MLCGEKVENTCSRKKGKMEKNCRHMGYFVYFWRVAVQRKLEENNFFKMFQIKRKMSDLILLWTLWCSGFTRWCLGSGWVESCIVLFNPSPVISAAVANGGSQRLSLLLGIAGWICGKEIGCVYLLLLLALLEWDCWRHLLSGSGFYKCILQRSALDFDSYKASCLEVILCVSFMHICEMCIEMMVFAIILKEHLFLSY